MERALDEGVARDWLTHLVSAEKAAFFTQKQALNALVFYFRDVCGRAEVDLQVRMRKRGAADAGGAGCARGGGAH